MRAAISWLAPVVSFLLCASALPAADRIVIIKVDGLPSDFRERYTRGDFGKLPAIQKVFEQDGTWFENFYVRGLSLSAPSWSLLDTGHHLEIRGNVEYDRYTLLPYDYLNFFPFYFEYARKQRADMPGVEMLDALGVPLLSDRFPYAARFQAAQLLQRGINWASFPSTLKRVLGDASPKQVFDEWQTGISWSEGYAKQRQKEVIDALRNPALHYLDYFATEYDHTAHLNADRVTLLHELEDLDDFVARIVDGIARSPYPESTVLALVSDHGMNGEEGLYSQGYNLVDWFTGAAGGGQHVLTNRHPLTEYKLRGLDPFVAQVMTPSSVPGYLSGLSETYPTVILDLDGNERASIGLRNNTFNKLHIVLDQIIRGQLRREVRVAALKAFFALRDEQRPVWEQDLNALGQELAALGERIQTLSQKLAKLPKKYSPEQREQGLEYRRQVARRDEMRVEHSAYRQYLQTMRRLLALDPADFDPGKFKIETVIPSKSFGPLNTLDDLRHYVTGLGAAGLVIREDGTLDVSNSFREIDYFTALAAIRVRNNLQENVGPQPIDFLAIRVPDPEEPANDAVRLWRSETQQALIQVRRRDDASIELRYRAPHQAGMPLELWDDPALRVSDKAAWLDAWHSENDWLRAVHETRYSNGVIGVVEQLLDLAPVRGTSLEERLKNRERNLRRTDILAFAADHWNFNVRGFNPGGNHGSFLRASTHSVLLMWGGKQTTIPQGRRISTPYDSLSFAPTILHLMGKPYEDLPGSPIPEVTSNR